MMFKKYSILILILIVTLWGGALYAQVRSTDIVLEIYPENPTPNQNVTAKLSSYVADVSKSYITWSINGEQRSGGVGKSTFSFNTENLNNIELIAMIETANGQNMTKVQNISPINVDILWEARDSYVPPFYKGKALVPKEGAFKVVAIPNVNTISGRVNTNNFSYTWEKDGQGQSKLSGWGKNSFVFYNSFLDRSNQISVKISNISGDINTESKISLNTSVPKILFYEKDPIFGIKMENAIDAESFKIEKDNINIVALPYFISPKNLNSADLSFDWSINDSDISVENPRNELSLKPTRNKPGKATVRLFVVNTKAMISGIEKEININF